MQPLLGGVSQKEINALLFVIVVAVYCNGLFGDYVHDDISAVVRNSDVQGRSPLWEVFLNDFWGLRISDPSSHKSYRPLTILTFRAERWLLGFSCSVLSHVINVLLHALATLLYVHVLRKCLRLTSSHALVSGTTFAVHSVHTEAVTGIVGRGDILAALTFLLAFYFYDRLLVEDGKRQVLHVILFVVLTCAGVLCKETSLAVTAVCFLWDGVFYLRKKSRKRQTEEDGEKLFTIALRISLLIFMTSFIVLLRVSLMKSTPTFSRQDNPVSFRNKWQTRVLTFSFLPAFNMWLLLCPWKLSHDWQMNSISPVEEIFETRNLAPFALFTCLFVLLVKATKNKGKENDAIIWSIGVLIFSFIPASNIFFRVGFVVAERILYIPSIGFCTIFGVGFLKTLRSLQNGTENKRLKGTLFQIGQISVLALFVLLSLRTLQRNADWLSRDRLLTSGLRALPQNAKMHYNYANLCRDEARSEDAIRFYLEALRLWPDYPSAHNNLGAVFWETNHPIEAEHHFNLALQYQPNHLHALSNLATLYKESNKTGSSIALLEKFLERKAPSSSTAFPDTKPSQDVIRLGLMLASLYGDEGFLKLEEDLYIQMSIEFPWSADIHASYGHFLVKQRKFKEAEKYLEAALSLDPSHARALTSYASIVHSNSHHKQAHTVFIRALDIGWDSDTATSLGKTHLQEGRLEEAAQVLSEVLIHDPNHLSANVHLAQVRLQQRHYPVSEALLRDVLKAFPNDRQALYHLSLLFATTNRSSESIKTAQKAAEGCTNPKELCAFLHAHLADLLHTNAMLEPAVQNYRKALDLEPSLVKAHLNLGAIYHTQSNYSHAWEHYSEALKLEPSNALLLENIYKLQRVFKTSNKHTLEGL